MVKRRCAVCAFPAEKSALFASASAEKMLSTDKTFLLARKIYRAARREGALDFPAHEFGEALRGPLRVFGGVEKWNISAAEDLSLRYLFDAVKRRDVTATVEHLRNVVSLWKRGDLERAA